MQQKQIKSLYDFLCGKQLKIKAITLNNQGAKSEGKDVI